MRTVAMDVLENDLIDDRRNRRIWSVSSLGFGIVSLPFAFTVIVPVIALVFGVAGLLHSDPAKERAQRMCAVIGMTLAGFWLIIGLMIWIGR